MNCNYLSLFCYPFNYLQLVLMKVKISNETLDIAINHYICNVHQPCKMLKATLFCLCIIRYSSPRHYLIDTVDEESSGIPKYDSPSSSLINR